MTGSRTALRAVPGVRVLDVQSDAAHHRSVLTFAGRRRGREAGSAAALRRTPWERSICARTSGEHPRLGAVDVCPFMPIEGVTMDDCVALAREVGAEVAARFNLPVYLYEEAAVHARHGATSRTSVAVSSKASPRRWQQPEWSPDFGPAAPHASAGATVIGARMPLIAYNINLATDRLDVAKKIASRHPHEQRRLPLT